VAPPQQRRLHAQAQAGGFLDEQDRTVADLGHADVPTLAAAGEHGQRLLVAVANQIDAHQRRARRHQVVQRARQTLLAGTRLTQQ
jgi:hypothetical protein